MGSFGTRAAVFNAGAFAGRSTVIRLHEPTALESESDAEGRYVYLRSFSFDYQLRFEGLALYAQRAAPSAPPVINARRTMQEEPEKEPEEEPENLEKEAAAEHAASQQRVALMRNLTLELCQIASRPR